MIPITLWIIILVAILSTLCAITFFLENWKNRDIAERKDHTNFLAMQKLETAVQAANGQRNSLSAKLVSTQADLAKLKEEYAHKDGEYSISQNTIISLSKRIQELSNELMARVNELKVAKNEAAVSHGISKTFCEQLEQERASAIQHRNDAVVLREQLEQERINRSQLEIEYEQQLEQERINRSQLEIECEQYRSQLASSNDLEKLKKERDEVFTSCILLESEKEQLAKKLKEKNDQTVMDTARMKRIRILLDKLAAAAAAIAVDEFPTDPVGKSVREKKDADAWAGGDWERFK